MLFVRDNCDKVSVVDNKGFTYAGRARPNTMYHSWTSTNIECNVFISL